MKNRWLVCPQPNSNATARLFLFPYAGGAPSAFNKWVAEFPEAIEVNIIHYPGRGSRFNEPPIKDLFVLVSEIASAIQPELDKPFFFFGHSLGALIAFELARQLNFQPQILFVSACGAPHISRTKRPIHSLPNVEFVKSVQELNGLPDEVANNAELLELILPTLRADFEVVENYRFKSAEKRLDCPIIAFGGDNDLHVDLTHLNAWGTHTNGNFKSQYFPGDHFFINTARSAVITSMKTEIGSFHA